MHFFPKYSVILKENEEPSSNFFVLVGKHSRYRTIVAESVRLCAFSRFKSKQFQESANMIFFNFFADKSKKFQLQIFTLYKEYTEFVLTCCYLNGTHFFEHTILIKKYTKNHAENIQFNNIQNDDAQHSMPITQMTDANIERWFVACRD